MRVSFMLSKVGRRLLVRENYTYSRYAELKSSGESAWKCSNKRCLAKVYTVGEEVTRSSGRHNHPPKDPGALTRARINNAVKQRATALAAQLPGDLIRSEIAGEDLARLTAKDIKLIRDSIYRSRLPPLPAAVPASLEKGDSIEGFDASQFMEEEYGNEEEEEEAEIKETKPVILEDGSVLSSSASVGESSSEDRERAEGPREKRKPPPLEALVARNGEAKRQRLEDEDSLLRQALGLLLKSRDEHAAFGEYLATELRQMRTERFRRKLRSRVRRAVAELVDQESLYLDGQD